jgi:hypothetical protein
MCVAQAHFSQQPANLDYGDLVLGQPELSRLNSSDAGYVIRVQVLNTTDHQGAFNASCSFECATKVGGVAWIGDLVQGGLIGARQEKAYQTSDFLIGGCKPRPSELPIKCSIRYRSGKEQTFVVQMPLPYELVRGNGPEVFAIDNGSRRWVPNKATFDAMGLSLKDVQRLSDQELNKTPRGVDFPSLSGRLVRGSGLAIFRLEDGLRRLIPNMATLNAMGLSSESVQTLSDQELNSIRSGTPYPPK